MATVENSFDSDEPLANIEAAVSGAESATLTESDYSESGSGPYTYTASYSATLDGVYAVKLITAEDSAGNDGAGGEQDETTTIGSIADTFEAGDLSNWSNTDDYAASQTQPQSGSYSMEYLGTQNTAFGNTQIQFNSSTQALTEWFFSVVFSAFDGIRRYSLTTGNDADTTGTTVSARFGVDDGTETGTAGNVFYYDGSGSVVDTGETLTTDQTYRFRPQAFDWSNDQYDLVVEDADGTELVAVTDVGFQDSMSGADYIKLNHTGGSAVYYDDFVTVL